MKLKFLIVLLSILLSFSNLSQSEETNHDVSFYTGTFDLIDKEGDDQTNLFGVEHKNSNLFRETF